MLLYLQACPELYRFQFHNFIHQRLELALHTIFAREAGLLCCKESLDEVDDDNDEETNTDNNNEAASIR